MDDEGRHGVVPLIERELAMIDQLIAVRVSASKDPPPSGTVN